MSIGLCMGICFSDSAIEQYKKIMNKIISILNGTDMTILQEMKQKMAEASMKFDFETAAKYRDYSDAIQALLTNEKVIEFTEANKNIVVLESLQDHRCKLFLIKGNRILFSEKYHLVDLNIEQFLHTLKINVSTHFWSDMPSTLEVSRDDIDEAQIIYRYLKGSTCKYIIIPDN
ncbi:UvrB/UvrC motif-containing protein [Neobacillus sp. OS1-2]|uniref:UvrB/UvrC motif-containing protein n=1 Tax=Neobacillus sp. OS1-2 TaxID=3070680 RepID=UPI0027E2155D|nr:UvrB/UvrC motif-containing protein [Neobacillus sp. OS1-2]WML38488.1 UvrB/UvrC motif-containing protein [Neobacillus sp. OS1-2]